VRGFLDDAGRTSRVIGILVDIDDRKASESNVRLLTAVLEAADNGIMITDTEGTILWVNRGFTKLTGYTAEECVGQSPRILKSGEQGHMVYEQLWATIKAGSVWRGELKDRRKDGSLYDVEMTVTPVASASGEVTHFVAIKQDVTERKKLERQYRQAQKMEAVGRLAGGIAHDFNNVLCVILGYCLLSLDTLAATHPVTKYVYNIKAAADRATSLVKQLLAFSRQQVVYPTVLDLNALVENMEDMLRRLVGEDVTVAVRPALPLGSIRADAGQIEQVIMNLVVNSRDAMPDGGAITIETCNVDLDEMYGPTLEPVKPGRYVKLSVSDTGCGMDEEIRAHIFEPFYTTKEPGRGTGLGLATVYGIVKQSGGYIWVHSEPGQGSTFKLYFPFIGEAPIPLVRTNEYTEIRGGSETVLLVEDDDAVRELVITILQNAGYTVLSASNGESALELAAKHPGDVDLLLSDIVMPTISGVRLIPMLTAFRPNLRVILMSGHATKTLGRQASLPADAVFLEKPFTKSSLLMAVQGVLCRNDEKCTPASQGPRAGDH
jgi:PAS domain S-box-containing protein